MSWQFWRQTRKTTNATDLHVLSFHLLLRWSPVGVCVGHQDWIFGVEWISENVVFTASRDRLIKVWRVPERPVEQGENVPTIEAASTLVFHSDRVRALAYSHRSHHLGTLGSDRRVGFWDAESGERIGSVPTRDREDLICLEVEDQYNLWAVGGRDSRGRPVRAPGGEQAQAHALPGEWR